MSASHFADSKPGPSTDSRFEQSLRVIYAELENAGADDSSENFEQWISDWNQQSDRIEEQLRFIEAQLGKVQDESHVQLFLGDAPNA